MGKAKDIREAVETELACDPLVGAADITVRNFNRDVALNGTVPATRSTSKRPRRRGACLG